MAETETARSPVRVLRDAFGDRKLPDITRKITACVACRKQKIKCHMPDSRPPCTRCRKRGLSCTVNRSLQAIMESDVSWKHSMEEKVKKLEDLVGKIAHAALDHETLEQLHLQLRPLSSQGLVPGRQGGAVANEVGEHSGEREILMDVDSGPGAIPVFHVIQPSTEPEAAADTIYGGVISLAKTQEYFDAYRDGLDHFPYCVLGDHANATFDQIRELSPFLLAAACTVGAFHLASHDFDICYKNFCSVAAGKGFSKSNTINDVRAFCIGAFWLDELSWVLVGAAVRIATELQLHRSFPMAIQGNKSHYERIRLYFQVYACDHHFSLAYGRPPMTRDCEAIRNVRQLMDCEHATEDDARLVSQILRWRVCSDIFDTFGANFEEPIPNAKIRSLRRFGLAFDNLREEWEDKFSTQAHIGNYPNKGVSLQHHFAKLYLYSHAFRGANSSQRLSQSNLATTEFNEIANSAVTAATSILQTIITDTEVQSLLKGLPVYFDTMVAFAAVFLFKISSKFSILVQIDAKEIHRLLNQLVTSLKVITTAMHPSHLLTKIAKSIETLLLSHGLFTNQGQSRPVNAAGSTMEVEPEGFDMTSANFNRGIEDTFDSSFLNEYDFLLGEDITPYFNLQSEMHLPEHATDDM